QRPLQDSPRRQGEAQERPDRPRISRRHHFAGGDPMTSRSRNIGALAAAQLTVNAEPYLSCDDCFEQVDVQVDAVVSGSASLPPAFRAHLIGCAACREEALSLLELAAQDLELDRETVLARFDRALVSHEGRES